MAATDWDSLRRNVRNLENELDQRISSYSKLATQLSTAYYSSQVSSTLSAGRADANKLELEISEMLEKVSRACRKAAVVVLKLLSMQLGKLVDDMTTSLDSRGTASTSAMGHTLTRHREILSDYQRDFKRTQNQVRDAEQRQTLLGSVRDEISAFKAGTGEDPSDMLLAERNRIDSSHRMTDQVLECVSCFRDINNAKAHHLQTSICDTARVLTAAQCYKRDQYSNEGRDECA